MAIEFPANPSDQDSFVANNVTYIYDGTLGVWNIYSGTTYNGGFGGSGGANVTVSDSAPSSPSAGDLWWESDVGRLKIYYDDGDTQQWVDASPSSNTVGGSNSVIAPAAIGIINNTSGTGTGLSWGNWDAGNGTLDITFDNAQPDANYAVVTDGEFQDDGRLVSVQNKTTTGFEISLYDVNGNVTSPSSINIFTVMVYASTPTQLVQTNPYSDNAVDSHLNVSTATTGEVLSWTGTDYDWITGGGGGASVTTSDTAPSNPSEGDLWYDTTELTTYVYYNDGNSSQWVNASPNGMSASLNISDTAPTNPSDGDLWFDSTTLKTFVYYNDGSSSQWVTLVPTTGGTGGGVTTYADTATMVAETPDAGSLGFVTANNNLYLYNGSGWGKVNVTNVAPVINSVEDDLGGTSPFSLATDGTPKTITVDATDAEGFPLTYTYSVSSGTVGTTATIVQGTGAQANEFTLTPGTNDPADVGTFDLTFTVDDGYASVDSTATFSLAFTLPLSGYGTRAVGAGYYQADLGDDTDVMYYYETTTGSATSTFGNLTSADRAMGVGVSNKTYGVFLGGRVWHTGQSWNNRMDYITFATTGSGTSFGTLSNETSTHSAAGTGDGTYGIYLRGGYASKPSPHPMDYITISTSGSASTWGTWSQSDIAVMTGNDTRGLMFGSSDIGYMTYASQSNANSFGTAQSGYGGNAFTDATYACYGSEMSTQYDYVTIDTLGNASTGGTLVANSRNQEFWSNDTGYGFYSRYSNSTGGIQQIAIATLGDSTSFFDQTPRTAWGASASGNNA